MDKIDLVLWISCLNTVILLVTWLTLSQKIEKNEKKITSKMDFLDSRLGNLDVRIGNLDTRIGNLDTRIGNLDTRTASIEKELLFNHPKNQSL